MLLVSSSALASGQERFALVMGANIGEPGDEPFDSLNKTPVNGADSQSVRLGQRGKSPAPSRAECRASRGRVRIIKSTNSIGKISRAGDALFVYFSGHADVTAMHLGTSRLEFERLTNSSNKLAPH